MRRVLALLIVGATLVLAPSLGLASTQAVDGTVTQKFISAADAANYVIAVDGTPYEVPLAFYVTVKVGDIVHFDGERWLVTAR